MGFPESNGIINGIMNYFQSENTTNYNVKVKTSSVQSDRKPINIVLQNNEASFITETSKNIKQNIIIELKHSILSTTSYTIRTASHHPDEYPHLRSWQFFGSIDKQKWELLDEHNDSQILNGQLLSINLNCSLNYKHLYRFYKIQQTGVGFTGVYGFGINYFDLFGTLYPSKYVPFYKFCTNRHMSKHTSNNLLLIILILIIE